MKSIVIFAGAGASYGVSREKYPTTVDFFKLLPSDIKANYLFQQVVNYLKGSAPKSEQKTIDIELVLWELQSLLDALVPWTSTDTFASKVLHQGYIDRFAAYGGGIGGSIHAKFAEANTAIRTLYNEINKCVYDLYAKKPTKAELEGSWKQLLDWAFKASFNRIDIVTTNYDLIIETELYSSSRYAEKVQMGHTSDATPEVDLERWTRPDDRVGLLTKLHGSIDWKLGSDGTKEEPVIRRGHPEFDGDHSKRHIIYPGYKGVPTDNPFKTFHDYFKSRVKEATHVLFIGFAFRDEYINLLLQEQLSPSTKIAVVNPVPTLPPLDFLDSAKHLNAGFGVPLKQTLLTAATGLTPFNPIDLNEWAS